MQQDLEYIYQVYKEKNFSKAAEKLFITQPALSMAIKKVEEQIGMPIFDRTTRPLSLTPAGEVYIEHIHNLLNLEQELNQQMEDIRSLDMGNICLGGSHYLNAYILPPVLSAFMKKYPKITVEIKETSSDVLAEMLSNRELDLTFNCNPRFMEGFERYPAFVDHVLLAVPKEMDPYVGQGAALDSLDVYQGVHLRQDCPVVSLECFRNLDFILLNKGNNLHDRALQLFEEAGIQPRVRMELSQLVTAYHYADAGIAASFISDRLVVPAKDHLNYYKLDSELTTRQFYILLPRRNYTTVAVKTFIRFFEDYIKKDACSWTNEGEKDLHEADKKKKRHA